MVKQATAVKTNRQAMLSDFYKFARLCCACGDYDPFHPLLRKIEKDMDVEDALWFSCLYIAYYNPGSAWVVFNGHNRLEYGDKPLPIETARRNLFGGRIYRHLEDLTTKVKSCGSLHKFFTQGFDGNPRHDWDTLRQTIGTVYGCGRWAEYTFAEILQKVNGFDVVPTDMGNEGSTGPRNGLILLMGEATNTSARKLYNLGAKYIKPTIPWFDYAILESLACDFNSINKGKYYLGRDIDRQQHRIQKAEKVVGYELPELWAARKKALPHKYLGELNGWVGIDTQRRKHYLETGRIIDR